jgi:hypothetical protein
MGTDITDTLDVTDRIIEVTYINGHHDDPGQHGNYGRYKIHRRQGRHKH